MVEKLPRIVVEKQGSHSENPPKGIEVPIRDALARHGFTEGCWCMKVRMVHARGESHSYRGAHFKGLRNYARARNVIDVVSQPGAAHTAFPADLIVPDCYDATHVLNTVRQINTLDPNKDEDLEMLKKASQFDVGASAKRRSNEPIASVRRSNEARQQRIAKFLGKPKNIDAVGVAIQRESLNGSVPISVLDKAIRETLPFQISRDELASTRAIFVLNEDLLQPGDGVYHLSERGQLWIESLRQRERDNEALAQQMQQQLLWRQLQKCERSLRQFDERVEAERSARLETIQQLKSQLGIFEQGSEEHVLVLS